MPSSPGVQASCLDRSRFCAKHRRQPHSPSMRRHPGLPEPALDAGRTEIVLIFEPITRACSDQMGGDVDQQAEHLASEASECRIVGRSLAIQRMLHLVRVVAPTDSTVLIEGETGSGKELVARTVCDLSGRRRKAFIKLNCAAMPAGLLESELFGHEKGAFTGATAQRRGRFELADEGTLFLDEIGDIPLELQPKLLRVLQEQEFERLGGTRTIRTDVRVVAATNRGLARMVEEGRFRAGLDYRLNVFPVRVPPLRERREDIPLLANFFVMASGRRLHRWFGPVPDATLEALTRYAWPGNVRELQHFVERGAILSTGSVLDLPLHGLATTDAPIPRSCLTLEDMEREYIVAVLRETNWGVPGSDGAAARLGAKRTTLFSKMRKLGIQPRGNPPSSGAPSPRPAPRGLRRPPRTPGRVVRAGGTVRTFRAYVASAAARRPTWSVPAVVSAGGPQG